MSGRAVGASDFQSTLDQRLDGRSDHEKKIAEIEARIRVMAGAVHGMLIRPRTSFVPEMLMSVEKI